jgi:hypothetical protein
MLTFAAHIQPRETCMVYEFHGAEDQKFEVAGE